MKKMFLQLFRVVLLAGLALGFVFGPAVMPAAARGSEVVVKPTLLVGAYIDGVSYLVIHGNQAHWYHEAFAAPGRHLFVDYPTFFMNKAWYPAWPDLPDAENRDCNCDSSTYTGVPALAAVEQTVTLSVITARNGASIYQQPTASNDYTLIVLFDDGPPGGAAWYKVGLTYKAAP